MFENNNEPQKKNRKSKEKKDYATEIIRSFNEKSG